MSTNLAPALRQFYYDSNGNPLSGGLLYSYQAGTTTPQVTYTDSTGGTPNANPVVLDASGGAQVWLDPSLSYKFILKDVNLVQQWSVDNVIGTLAAGSVITATIQDGSVTRAKLAAGAVSNFGVVTKNAVFTAAVTDDIYLCDTSSGAYIATLPTAIGNSGKRLTFKKTTNDLNTLTVKGNGADTVDGSNTVLVYSQNDSIAVVSDGSNWKITDCISASVNMRAETPTGTPPSSSTQIVFPTVSFDSHGAYNSSTGTYTVPTPGVYRVSSSICIDGTFAAGNASEIHLMKNSTGFGFFRNDQGGNFTGLCTSASATIKALQGDTFSVKFFTDASGPTYYSGANTNHGNNFCVERIGN